LSLHLQSVYVVLLKKTVMLDDLKRKKRRDGVEGMR